MTIRIIKSNQFCKIIKQAQNKQAGRKYFPDLLNKQAENLQAERKKYLKNLSEHALLLGPSEYSGIVKPFDEEVIRFNSSWAL